MGLGNGNGAAEAVEAFYREHRERLFAAALAVAGCRERAEDAVHEAVAGTLRSGAAPRDLRGYLFRAVRNAAVDQLRRRPRESGEPSESFFDPAPSPRGAAQDAEFAGRVDRALRSLADDEREAVVYRLYADLTFREIAETMDAPQGTVASWYRRGIEKLRRELEDAR